MADGELENLRKKLYGRDESDFNKRTKREKINASKEKAPSSFWRSETEENTSNLKRVMDSYYEEKKFPFFWAGIGFLAFVFLSLMIYFFGDFLGIGGNIVSSKKINLELDGPSIISSGEVANWVISIKNNNDVDLELADLIIEFPEGTLSSQGDAIKKERRSLGKIPPNGVKKEDLSVFLLGEEDASKEIKLILEYRVSNSNAIFAKDEKKIIKMSRSPVGISINFPKEIESGQKAKITVEYVSNSEVILKDVYLQMQYPPGFNFLESNVVPFSGKNLWKIGDLMPHEERTLDITGTLSGQDSMDVSFGASMGKYNDENNLVMFSLSTSSVLLRKTFFDLSFYFKGDQSDFVLPGKNNISGELLWKNNTISEIRNINLKTILNGETVNTKTISIENGFYKSSEDALVWNPSSNEELSLVTPGQSGSAKFSFSLVNPLPVKSFDDKNFKIVLEAEMTASQSGDDGQTSSVKSVASDEIKIASEINLESRLLRSSGPFDNSGPIPPKVGTPTTYTVNWSVSNLYNDVSDAVVKASLPSYVAWSGVASPSTEDISYNSSTNEIIWKIGTISASTGILRPKKEVFFKISFLPSPNQEGNSPELVLMSSLEARDLFVDTILRDLSGKLYTNSTSEATIDQTKGVVVE